ncbi:hypothetical protein FBU59_007297, partial [Linderina macrospora]
QQHGVNVGGSKGNEGEEAAPRMVNGVPPGLPSTGLFGELLRQSSRQGGAAAALDGSAVSAGAPMLSADCSKVISGKMMLGDIERQLEAAQREARVLHAQLNTVKGQGQPVGWAPVTSSGNGMGMATKAEGGGRNGLSM